MKRISIAPCLIVFICACGAEPMEMEREDIAAQQLSGTDTISGSWSGTARCQASVVTREWVLCPNGELIGTTTETSGRRTIETLDLGSYVFNGDRVRASYVEISKGGRERRVNFLAYDDERDALLVLYGCPLVLTRDEVAMDDICEQQKR